jgi:N utilization substance protein B
MINRVLLRTKVLQILYSHYKGDGTSLPLAEKELFFSLEKTYDLYFYLLQLSLDITRYAADRIDAGKNKMRPTAEEINPNTRFADNRFIAQLSKNEQLNDYLKKRKLSWVNHPELIKNLYEEIIASDFYEEYMNAKISDYSADKDIWKKVFKKILLSSEELDEVIEEQSVFWVDDIEIVISFILKTIKRFEVENGAEQELLPMFHDDEDREFGLKLLKSTIEKGDEYLKLIDTHTRNWDLDRIVFMDILIMQTAIAEICNFPTIPINVTLNEYIEISKKYSTEKSGTFINGVLDNVVNQLKSENKLIKVISFKK